MSSAYFKYRINTSDNVMTEGSSQIVQTDGLTSGLTTSFIIGVCFFVPGAYRHSVCIEMETVYTESVIYYFGILIF